MKTHKFLRLKPLETASQEPDYEGERLNRVLGKWDLVMLGIGAVIGAGIFVITGTAAAGGAGYLGAGPAIVLSFLITGIACGFSALCYAELASMIPIAGSAYTYSYTALGEIFAWIIGWDLILEYMVASSAVAIGWSGYCRSFLKTAFGGRDIMPLWLSNNTMEINAAVLNPTPHISKIAENFPDLAAKLSSIFSTPSIQDKPAAAVNAINSIPAYLNSDTASIATSNFLNLMEIAASAPHIGSFFFCMNLPAFLIVLGITILLVLGVSQTSKINIFIVCLKFAIILIFIIVGVQHIDPANWVPFMPNGLKGVQTGAAIIFFAYIGFDAISTAAEETKNPAKDLPFGIIVSLAICSGLYMIVSGIMTGICPWNKLGTSEPIATALEYIGQYEIAAYIVSIGAVISLLAVLIVMLMAQPRIFMSMSRDGFFPSWISKIHPKFKTPYRSTIINGIIVGLLAAVFTINEIAELCNIGTLFAFIIVCGAIIILRIKKPDVKRPFKTPLCPWIPILGIITCAYLMIGLPITAWIRFIIWQTIGVLIYLLYGQYHTKSFNDKNTE